MHMKALYRITVCAGATPDTLVAQRSLHDSAGEELIALEDIPLAPGTVLDIGQVSVEVEISFKSGPESQQTPPQKQTTTQAIAAQKAQQSHQPGRR